MKNWSEENEEGECMATADAEDTRRVAVSA